MRTLWGAVVDLLENVILGTVLLEVWKTRDYMLKYKSCFNTAASLTSGSKSNINGKVAGKANMTPLLVGVLRRALGRSFNRARSAF